MIRRVALRLPGFYHRIPQWSARDHHQQPVCYQGDWYPWQDTERVHNQQALLRLQTYCDSFFVGDDVLEEEASRCRRIFFKRRDEGYGRGNGHGAWFHLAIHYVFQEHKAVLQQVARELGIVVYSGQSEDDPPGTDYVLDRVVKRAQELSEALKLQEAAPLLGFEATRRALQTLRLAQRRLVMEDGYCRYMTSFGPELVDWLVRLSPDERQTFTLEKFWRFSLAQVPYACYPPRTLGSCRREFKWPAAWKGTWADSRDRSRMAYAAWFWDVARLAKVGTNSY
jgi:hypothetical protein